jgi:hypothetical protein
MAFNEKLNNFLEETQKKKKTSIMILYLQKKSIQEEKYFVLGKIQGTINGKKGC